MPFQRVETSLSQVISLQAKRDTPSLQGCVFTVTHFHSSLLFSDSKYQMVFQNKQLFLKYGTPKNIGEVEPLTMYIQ